MNQQAIEGFSIKTIIAAFIIGFLFLPAGIYLALVTGGGVLGAAEWVIVILFMEIAKRTFIKLTKQEIYTIYLLVGGVALASASFGLGIAIFGGPFAINLWRQYFVQSVPAKAFGLSELIPTWAVPPANSEAILKRTFFHSAWMIPILLIIFHQVFIRLNFFGLAYPFYRLMRDVERLPYPMARISVEGATAIAESGEKETTWRWRTFSIAAMIGVVYGAIYVSIPTITSLFMAKPLQIIPIPWVDFTASIGKYLPACQMGFMTSLAEIFVGMVLPFTVVIGMCISSLFVNFAVNPILYHQGILRHWKCGMGVVPTAFSNSMDFWIGFTIGAGISVGIIGFITAISAFIKRRTKKSKLTEVPPLPQKFMSIKTALLIWFMSATAYVIVCHILVPQFPIWIFMILGYLLTPFLTLISARMFGITGSPTGTGISFPLIIQGAYLLCGYRGAAVWFVPSPLFDHGMATQRFKEMELLNLKFTTWVKVEITALLIMLICSFIFCSLIWKLAPIPSAAYPFTQKMWPFHARVDAMWISSTVPGGPKWLFEALKPSILLTGGIISLSLYGIINLLLKLPAALFYGFIGGLALWPHHILPMLAGALLGKFYFQKRFGPEWRRYPAVLAAGYACGMGLIGMASVAITLIGKSVAQIIF